MINISCSLAIFGYMYRGGGGCWWYVEVVGVFSGCLVLPLMS